MRIASKKLAIPETRVSGTPKWIFLRLRELFPKMVIKRFLLTINHFDAIMTMVTIVRKGRYLMLLRAKISKGGKISIPSIYRKMLQFKDGEEVVLDMKNDTLVISSLRCLLEKSRQLVNQYHSANESLVDKLLAERKEEAKHE